jgi:glycerol-3-phosphate acyltransferase PlsX
MRIAVDAMGGDYAPAEIVAGAVKAARDNPAVTRLILVGDQDAVRKELEKHKPVPASIEVFHASEIITMEEAPAQAVMKKRDSSINRMIDLVKNGEADAAVSAGNTGAVMGAAHLKLRTLEGVLRPAIAAILPTRQRPLILIDAGANTDTDPILLRQFAVMGSVYAREILGQPSPVVGLLSNGGEDSKGNKLAKETFPLLAASHLNFRGNVEGHDVFEGKTDVVVCDGFVGNVLLKTAESVAHAIGHWLKEELTANPIRILAALLLRRALKNMKVRMDPETYGGAPLLGINGVCIITHGASRAKAIYQAIRVAGDWIGHDLNKGIVEEIRKLSNNDESQAK